MENYNEEPILGVHLGNTNNCIAIYRNSHAEVIPNECGNRTTSSFISFIKKEILIGDSAKGYRVKNYNNTIYDIKNMLGKNFDDIELQRDIKNSHFKVIKSNNNKPKIEVEFKGETKTFFPEEIIAMILSQLKKYAKDFLGRDINDIILTCPAYFNDYQRKALKDACKIAGLNIIKLIDEPISVALAYGLDNNNIECQNILIFYLGGKKLDVTILRIIGNFIEIKGSARDMHLGGDNFDNKLIEHCIKEFYDYTGIDISHNLKPKLRLKIECERAKKNLSSSSETCIDIDSLSEGEDLNVTVSRPEFEDMCEEYFKKFISVIEEALKNANLKKYNINDFIIVGGSTRIPKIQQILKEYFGKEPTNKIHPDEVIAIGASIQGYRENLNLENIDGIEKLIFLDYTHLSIGYELSNGEMEIVIPKNTSIPCEKNIRCQTIKDNQSTIIFKIYEGERLLAKGNKFLGRYEINNIPPKPKGKIIININFQINTNGILNVILEENFSGRCNNKTFYLNNDIDVVKKIINEAEEMKQNDKSIIETNKSKQQLINYCLKKKNEGNNIEKVKANEIIQWININSSLRKEDFENQLNEFKNINLNNSLKFVKLSIGYELNNGEMKFVIERNKIIPIKKSFIYETENYQNEIKIKIYEGERLLAKRNNLLKECVVKILQNQLTTNFTFEINNNYLLNIYSNSNKIESIQLDENIEDEDIEDKVQIAEKMRKNDQNDIATLNNKLQLKKFAFKLKSKCEEILMWIESNPKVGKEKYEEELKKLKNFQ